MPAAVSTRRAHLLGGASTDELERGSISHRLAGRAGRVDLFRAPVYSMTMKRSEASSGVLTIRIGVELKRSLGREERRRRTTRSELVRELISAGLAGDEMASSLAQEARRQSTLVSGRESEGEALEFLENVADPRGWD